MKNILAICGSLRPGSSNHKILEMLSTWMPADIGFSIYRDMELLPHFVPLNADELTPAIVQELYRQLDNATAVVICTPEYAFGVPGALKNLLDWTVGTGNLVDKPMALITASSKGDDAHAALLKILGALSANIVDALHLPFIRARFGNDGELNEETKGLLREVWTQVIKVINT